MTPPTVVAVTTVFEGASPCCGGLCAGVGGAPIVMAILPPMPPGVGLAPVSMSEPALITMVPALTF